MPARFTEPIRRLLTNRWQFASFVAVSIAVVSLIPKWYGHPQPHLSILVVHDLSITIGLVCAVLSYYFEPRTFSGPSPPQSDEGRDGDWWVSTKR